LFRPLIIVILLWNLPLRELFAFWTGTERWPDFNFTTLTTIGAFADVPEELLCMAHENNVRVVLASGRCPSLTNPEGEACPADVNSTEAVEIWSDYLVNRTNAEGLDGVNLDIEGGILPEHRDDLTAAVMTLRRKMLERNPLSQLSMDSFCLPTDPTRSKFYDWVELTDIVDFIFAMCYDMPFMVQNIYSEFYETAWEFSEAPLVQAAFPMLRRGIDQHIELSINITSKVVLGLPWYGYEFDCTQPHGSQCIMYEDWVNQKPRPSREIDLKDILDISRGGGDVTDEGEDEENAAKFLEYNVEGLRHEIWYDDAETLARKYKLAEDFNMKGVGWWTVDAIYHDDPADDDVENIQAMWDALEVFSLVK